MALEPRGRGGVVTVENAGPPLPEPAQARLFDSMVTLRDRDPLPDPKRRENNRGGNEHLGLGLYIVRLVAEFHGGTVRAENLPGGAGVRFAVELP